MGSLIGARLLSLAAVLIVTLVPASAHPVPPPATPTANHAHVSASSSHSSIDNVPWD